LIVLRFTTTAQLQAQHVNHFQVQDYQAQGCRLAAHAQLQVEMHLRAPRNRTMPPPTTTTATMTTMTKHWFDCLQPIARFR
jgi:hypothetical protein